MQGTGLKKFNKSKKGLNSLTIRKINLLINPI